MSEAFVAGSTTTFRDYVKADGVIVVVRLAQGSSVTPQYLVSDHLGGAALVTDANSNVLQRLSYDAWGARRNPDGTVPVAPIVGIITRGFTGQEMMDDVGPINFNARLGACPRAGRRPDPGDPQLGRFVSADPSIADAYLTKLLDRYGYVGDNPLSLTDPSGLCYISCFWESGIFRDILAIVAALTLNYEILPVIEGAGIGTDVSLTAFDLALNAGISGGVAGLISSGNLKGALFGAAEGFAFFAVGGVLQADKLVGAKQVAARFVAHGFVGGLFTAAEGGQFRAAA